MDGGNVSGANDLGGGDGSVARTGCGGLGPVADDLAVASTEAAFPRATATETRWYSHAVSRLSPVRAVSLRPSSFTSSAAAGPTTPAVSTAKGTKMYLSQREAYRARLRSSAPRAALPGSKADWITAVAEKVSEQVASHTKLFPLLYGNSVSPSGRRPSPLSSPAGSRTLSSPAPQSARRSTSFRFE